MARWGSVAANTGAAQWHAHDWRAPSSGVGAAGCTCALSPPVSRLSAAAAPVVGGYRGCRVRVDRRQQQHVVADADVGREGGGNGSVGFVRPRIQRRAAERHADDRGADVLGDAGGRGLHLRDLAGESGRYRRRWPRTWRLLPRPAAGGPASATNVVDDTDIGASGSGNGSVGFSATANTGTPRSGTLTIGGQTFSVNQAAVGCTYALSPASQSVVAGGGTGSTAVTAPTGCAWTGVSNNAGMVDGDERREWQRQWRGRLCASSNPNTSTRTGTIIIGGQTFSVTQAAAACTYALSPASQSVVAGGGTGLRR